MRRSKEPQRACSEAEAKDTGTQNNIGTTTVTEPEDEGRLELGTARSSHSGKRSVLSFTVKPKRTGDPATPLVGIYPRNENACPPRSLPGSVPSDCVHSNLTGAAPEAQPGATNQRPTFHARAADPRRRGCGLCGFTSMRGFL